MKFTTQAVVRGMKKFNDEVEGQRYDFTKLFIESDLDESKGTAKGQTCVEYEFGTSEEFDKMKNYPFPFPATLEIELVTNGKTSKQRVLSVKPMKADAAAVVK